MQLLQSYWPIGLFLIWIIWRTWNAQKVLRLLPSLRARGAICIDVRSAAEYAGAHAAGTLNIPLDQLALRASEIPKGKPILVCCASGLRSASARGILRGAGFAEVYNIGPWNRLL